MEKTIKIELTKKELDTITSSLFDSLMNASDNLKRVSKFKLTKKEIDSGISQQEWFNHYNEEFSKVYELHHKLFKLEQYNTSGETK